MRRYGRSSSSKWIRKWDMHLLGLIAEAGVHVRARVRDVFAQQLRRDGVSISGAVYEQPLLQRHAPVLAAAVPVCAGAPAGPAQATEAGGSTVLLQAQPRRLCAVHLACMHAVPLALRVCEAPLQQRLYGLVLVACHIR